MSSLLTLGTLQQIRNTSVVIPGFLTTDLVLFLDSGDTSSYFFPASGNTWDDISGQGIVGNLVGNTSYSSDFDGIITLDVGITNGRVDLSSLQSFDHTEPHTYCCFIRPSSYPTGQPYYWIINNGSLNTGTSIILQRNGNTTDYSFLSFMYNGGNNLHSSAPLSNSGGPLFEDVSVKVNTWAMIATVYENGNVTYYINDNNLGTRPITANANFSSGNFNPRVGAWQNAAFPFFGDVPVISVYSSALSDSDLLQNFNALRNRYNLSLSS